ncbi:Ohr family peroxiredoxin [Micromonospora echinofusca]|uniref:Ohr family peroxiredoxin n=1 Tax=Micromonospora echinofusca TaxID=47858 RepID=A0ABS3VMD2_MICEH|nr:Ohr family peroxiredoxin [Micromonospora echinofusca]MBO4205671.1 Ohr family peroxiredoxin [Micromonospora echinofusca]
MSPGTSVEVATAVPTNVVYTAVVQVSGGRGGTARSLTGSLRVELTRPAQRGPDATGTDPEELFAAGYAACFDSALAIAARQVDVRPGPTAVTASVSLGQTEAGRYAIAVLLEVSAPQCPQADLERAVAVADQMCPYSNALRGNTPVTIQVDGHR